MQSKRKKKQLVTDDRTALVYKRYYRWRSVAFDSHIRWQLQLNSGRRAACACVVVVHNTYAFALGAWRHGRCRDPGTWTRPGPAPPDGHTPLTPPCRSCVVCATERYIYIIKYVMSDDAVTFMQQMRLHRIWGLMKLWKSLHHTSSWNHAAISLAYVCVTARRY